MEEQVRAMRGHAEYNEKGEITSGGTLLFWWDDRNKPHLMLYREWEGKPLEPGKDVLLIGLLDVPW